MKKTLAVALLAAVAAPSLAADSGFYAGVNLGQSKTGNPYPGMSQTKSSDTAVGVLAGYQFSKNVGVEAGQSHESYRRPRRSSRYWTFEAARRRWTLRPPLCLTGA
jgi:opacity protein-like surface antigen